MIAINIIFASGCGTKQIIEIISNCHEKEKHETVEKYCMMKMKQVKVYHNKMDESSQLGNSGYHSQSSRTFQLIRGGFDASQEREGMGHGFRKMMHMQLI